MAFEKYCDNYFKKESIDLRNSFTNIELETIHKLDIKIDNKFYTVNEYIDLKRDLGIFCNINNSSELKYLKPSKYNVNKFEFNQLCNKFNEIDMKYIDLIKDFKRKIYFEDIWYAEKVHIRDKLIIVLNENILDDIQNQQLLEIIMNIEDVKIVSKQRFITYYGLDKSKEKINSYTKIAKIERCSASNIRQSVYQIRRKLLRVSNEELDVLRTIVTKY